MKDCPPFLQQQCAKEYKLGVWNTASDGAIFFEWHNTYATTIHAINSAIITLSKITNAVPVYRGLSRAGLPKQFFEKNERGLALSLIHI